MPTDRIWHRMMSAISWTASGSQVAASPIGVGKAVKLGATTPFNASLWKIAGILRRVSVTRYRWIALTLLAISSGSLWPSRPMPATCPMPCPSRLSIWPGIGPSVPSKASGTTEDSCIAFFDRHLTQQTHPRAGSGWRRNRW